MNSIPTSRVDTNSKDNFKYEVNNIVEGIRDLSIVLNKFADDLLKLYQSEAYPSHIRLILRATLVSSADRTLSTTKNINELLPSLEDLNNASRILKILNRIYTHLNSHKNQIESLRVNDSKHFELISNQYYVLIEIVKNLIDFLVNQGITPEQEDPLPQPRPIQSLIIVEA